MAGRPSVDRIRLQGSALPGLQLMQADSGRSFPRHSHDLYGIGLIDRGGQRSASGQGVVEALPGDVITVNPGEVHDGVALAGQPRSWRMLYVAPALLAEAGRLPELTRAALRDPALRQRFEALFAAALRGAEPLALEAGLVLLRQQAPLANAADGAGQGCPRGQSRLLERVRARLAEVNLPAPSLAALAQEAGLSRFQLLRAFAAAFGLPPHAWLLQRRLARARDAIANGAALADAAAAAGFADQSHMTRVFTRCWGFTPGAYAAACGR